MDKKHKYYYKVMNHELFGGEGSEGYVSLGFTDEEDNPVEVAKSSLALASTLEGVEVIEISEEEYIEATEEV